MSELRTAKKKQVIDTLSECKFGLENFSLSFNVEGKYFTVEFIPNVNYKLSVNEDTERYNFKIEYSPGGFTPSGSMRTDDFSSVISSISNWVERIDEELSSSSIYLRTDDLDSLKKDIENYVNEKLENPSGLFSKEESRNLEEKLDELSKRFEEFQAKHEITQSECDSLKKVVRLMKEDVDKYQKGIWYRVSGNKLLGAISKVMSSKEGKSILFKGAKKIIGIEES